MRLTKRKAFQVCKELWTWMRDGAYVSDGHKDLWPGWKKYGVMRNACPCCEYAYSTYSRRGKGCSGCLLLHLWPKGCTMDDGSPYDSFYADRGTPEGAQLIIDGCDREIAKLDRAEKRRKEKKPCGT